MYSRYDYEAYEDMFERQLEKEMHDLRIESLEKLRLVVHSEIVESFGALLAASYLDYGDDSDIVKISRLCNLSKFNLLSLGNDCERFKKEYENELQKRREEDSADIALE